MRALEAVTSIVMLAGKLAMTSDASTPGPITGDGDAGGSRSALRVNFAAVLRMISPPTTVYAPSVSVPSLTRRPAQDDAGLPAASKRASIQILPCTSLKLVLPATGVPRMVTTATTWLPYLRLTLWGRGIGMKTQDTPGLSPPLKAPTDP